MLLNLQIKNFAIIDKLEIDFESGLTIITGETGAGKSIIIQSLDICFGKKIEKHMFFNNQKPCDLVCQFDISNNTYVNNWLKDNDFINDDDQIIIRRVLSKEGRAKNYINGTITNLAKIKELASLLINIHGQHESQSLLRPDTQLKLLDGYANNKGLIGKLNNIYHTWKKINEEIIGLSQKNSDPAQKELLTYQINELEQVAISRGELQKIEKQHKLLANNHEIIENSQKAISWLTNDNDCIQDKIINMIACLKPFATYSSNIKQTTDCLEQAQIQVTEASDELNSYLYSQEHDSTSLEQIDKNLQSIHDLARKLRQSPYDLLSYKEELCQKLNLIDKKSEILEQLSKEKEDLENKYFTLAKKLTLDRTTAAKKLDQNVTKNIKSLSIYGPFTTQIDTKMSDIPRLNGQDQVTFNIRTNPNTSSLPIEKIASGGELSRISLALQSVTTDKFAIPALIFDEVDTGIDGATAETVGTLLQKISKNAQVICITHLPQVASLGNHHMKVAKNPKNYSTGITMLGHSERVNEVARMLAGTTISKKAISHAKEMISE